MRATARQQITGEAQRDLDANARATGNHLAGQRGVGSDISVDVIGIGVTQAIKKCATDLRATIGRACALIAAAFIEYGGRDLAHIGVDGGAEYDHLHQRHDRSEYDRHAITARVQDLLIEHRTKSRERVHVAISSSR